jgi:flagellar biogenesis protein FliO
MKHLYRVFLFCLFILTPILKADDGKIVAVFPEKEQNIAQAQDSSSQIEMPTQRYEASIVKVFMSFLGLIALAALSFWLFRRVNRLRLSGSGAKSIAILERRALSPKTMLYYLEIEGKKVLVAESHLEVKKLESWDKPKEAD